jgi:hypothetical protein
MLFHALLILGGAAATIFGMLGLMGSVPWFGDNPLAFMFGIGARFFTHVGMFGMSFAGDTASVAGGTTRPVEDPIRDIWGSAAVQVVIPSRGLAALG